MTTTTTRLKTGGRKQGTPNMLTYQARLMLLSAITSEIDKLPDTLAELEPHQRVDAMCKLMKYVLPAMETVSPRLADKIGIRDDSDIRTELMLENDHNNRERAKYNF